MAYAGLTIETVNSSVFVTPTLLCLELTRFEEPFSPGDCVNISLDGKVSQPYCIASGTNENLLRFYVRLVEDGAVSSQLASLNQGDAVYVSKPFGWLKLDSVREVPQLGCFICTGTGIAPFLSFFKSYPDYVPGLFIYGVKKEADALELPFLNTIPNFQLAISREEVAPHFSGRVTDLLRGINLDPSKQYYLCGLREMVEDTADLLENAGVDYFSNIYQAPFYRNDPFA